MKTNLKNYLPLLILLFAVSLSYGQSKAGGLQELVGEKGNYVENDLKKRDYYHIKTVKNGNSAYSYWWSSYKKKCVSVRVSDGRVKHILNTPSYDCNKNSNGSSIHSHNSNSNYNENYSHDKYNNDNFNNNYHTRDSREYNGHAEVHDLMKISAPLAYEKLQDRGFINVKTVKGKDKLYKIWYNHETNQCIKTVSLHKHIHDILKSTHCNN